jgi:hypothetical protein
MRKHRRRISGDARVVLVLGILLSFLALAGDHVTWRVYLSGVFLGWGTLMVAVDWQDNRP